MQQESIYNIIPHNPEASPKLPRYRSKYPPNIPPTGSTFGNHTTSRPGVSNLSGEFDLGLEAHKAKSASQTFGHIKGLRNSSPDTFLKKRTGIMGNHDLPPIKNFSYDCSHKKQNVPKSTDRPIYGKKSNRDFIVSNAVQAILSTPKQSPKTFDWTKKSNYGKTPEYLTFIKQTLDSEYRFLQTMHEQKEQKQKMLSQEQIEEIREGLKRKWTQVNRQYQKMTHIKLVDTLGLKNKKQKFEAELAQIEADIKKLNKQYVFVK